MSDVWPTELRLSQQGRELKVTFDNGTSVAISAELLRVESPSAEVKGHGPGQEILVLGKQNVSITRIEPVGSYAVRLIFDDGHSTGIFTWSYLQKLGTDHDEMMQAYRNRVIKK
jgi:DUF971 family protein